MVAPGLCWASQVVLVVKNLPANAGDERDVGLISGLGRFPWRREWQPTPVFWPGKFMSGEFMSGLETLVHGVAKSQTQLSNIHFTSQQPM